MGNGQPRVIFDKTLMEMSPMLHTCFQCHKPFVSSEYDVEGGLPYISLAAICAMRPRYSGNISFSTYPWKLLNGWRSEKKGHCST